MGVRYPKNRQEVEQNSWQEIDQERYDYYFEVLPPKRIASYSAFMVGEPLCHFPDDDDPVHEACIMVNKRFFCRPENVSMWNPTRYRQEVWAEHF